MEWFRLEIYYAIGMFKYVYLETPIITHIKGIQISTLNASSKVEKAAAQNVEENESKVPIGS